MTDAAENAATLPHLRREDFIANLVTARGRGVSYTAESVEAVVDNFVGNGNALVDTINDLNARPATVGAEDAERLTREAQARAAKIVADAERGAKETTDAAHAEAERVTGEAQAWANDLHERTDAEIKAALDAAHAELTRLAGIRDAAEARISYVTGRLAEFHKQQAEEIAALGASVHEDEAPVENHAAPAADADALPLEDADVEVSVDERADIDAEASDLAEKPARRR
jgi:cell division septum initiation protein DivIVA